MDDGAATSALLALDAAESAWVASDCALLEASSALAVWVRREIRNQHETSPCKSKLMSTQYAREKEWRRNRQTETVTYTLAGMNFEFALLWSGIGDGMRDGFFGL
jgi:hypothetical protein